MRASRPPAWSKHWRGFSPLGPNLRTVGFAATAAEGNAALSATGNPVTDCADNTFYFIFDRPLIGDYLITVRANGHTYGVVSLAKDRKPSYFKLYFELNDGKQTDFLDGQKVEEAESAKFDMASFKGKAVLDVYRTAAQAEGVYPAGLRLMYHRTLRIANGE